MRFFPKTVHSRGFWVGWSGCCRPCRWAGGASGKWGALWWCGRARSGWGRCRPCRLRPEPQPDARCEGNLPGEQTQKCSLAEVLLWNFWKISEPCPLRTRHSGSEQQPSRVKLLTTFQTPRGKRLPRLPHWDRHGFGPFRLNSHCNRTNHLNLRFNLVEYYV